jgi:monoamine oxidase
MAFAGAVHDFDVVVVGAGAAGIAATATLRAAGLAVICLEAASRVGGRAHTDTAIFGVPYDIGAHWLHNEQTNALKAQGLALGLDLYPAPEIEVTQGLQKVPVAWNAVDALFETIVDIAKADAATEARTGQPTDRSLADILTDSNPWSYAAARVIALSIGRDLADTSLRDIAAWQGGDDWFCRQGFGHLVARLAEGLPIRLATPVTDIVAGPGGVRIATPAGTVTARAAIVTVSVGVLAAEVIRFDPPLTADRRAAFDVVTMGDYNHTALMLRPGALPVAADTWLTCRMQPDDDALLRGGGFLCNIAGTNLTSFETSGSYSRALQAAGPDAAIEAALDTLAELFGSDIRRDFLHGHATAWRNDPWVRGSYAGASPGGHAQRRVLGMAHADAVHFAGEASHVGQQCSVSGAWLEGQRAARDVIGQLAGVQG